MADFTRVDGIVVSFVVRLMYINEGLELLDIARYDGAHGVPHLDQMDHKGRLIQKLWIPRLDFDLAVEYALEDFKKNYETRLLYVALIDSMSEEYPAEFGYHFRDWISTFENDS